MAEETLAEHQAGGMRELRQIAEMIEPARDVNGVWCGSLIEAVQAVQKERDNLKDTAVRYAVLRNICERILWTDVGKPAMENERTRTALEELSEFMFYDAINEVTGKASSTALLQKDTRHD